MSSKQNGPTEIECGSSLAEDAWTFSLPSTADALSQKQARINTTSHDEAAIQLRQLRSQIASDIIIDSVNTNNESSPYPTFLSPLQLPSMAPHTGTPVPLIYCDHTASHRPSASIENFLRSRSYPCHANTHTNITYTGSQSTAFVAEARQIVAESTGARVTGKASVDCVIFTGNGVTGAVATLIDALNLRAAIKDDNRPIVFVGPHEHHSNLLPWREAGCEVVNVPADKGMVDLVALECMLSSKKFGNNSTRLRIGTFSAVSNVTGLIADVDQIAILLHRYHCLAFFDYASGAPYLKMNMNPLQSEAYKDGIYFSPHKCYGGTSTPGVLVVKKRLVSQTNPPRVCGGGTVFYVTEDSHRFLSNRIERYEVSLDF
jgi:selenocysteine lyase/cysteine desulfurase